ncbi:anthranilate phosphoribosyltransferase [candidate division KSB1 bacterium]|nr:anthranilate phosphoribosyltransferase [candidate division KSB1 bacterium]
MFEFSKLLEKILHHHSLTENEAYELMCEILTGNLSGEKIAGLLTGLRLKGESHEEVFGFVKAMREFAVKIETSLPVVDTCGTGGDGAQTFNISTTAAFIAAGAGVPIAKHHNRSVSSRCGSADVLEELGININMSPELVNQAIDTIGIGFCFAPHYHHSMKYAAKVRQELGVRTVFNMLGPLLNPFLAKRQVIGVFAPNLTEFYAEILKKLGSEHICIVHGEDGLDEFTLCAPTRLTELIQGKISTRIFLPEDFGFQRVDNSELIGGDKAENARILKEILSGKINAQRHVAVLNAALAIYCGGRALSIDEGVLRAQESIDSGAALTKLHQLVAFSRNEVN